MRRVAVFVEGGGSGARNARDDCRIGFGRLIERALPRGSSRPQVIACGARSSAYDQFKQAVERRTYDVAVLLIDAEGPIEAGCEKWRHLKSAPESRHWICPAGADESHLYFMAESMEAWLVADMDALKKYYGKDFNPKPLESYSRPERFGKQTLLDSLKKATKDAGANSYDKGRHSFHILACVNPDTLRARCPDHAAPFLSAIAGLMAQKH